MMGLSAAIGRRPGGLHGGEVPDMPGRSDAEFSNAGVRSNLLIVLVCCLGVISLLVGVAASWSTT